MTTSNKKRSKLRAFAWLLPVVLGWVSCSENYSFEPTTVTGPAFDASQPVQVTSLLPDSGGYLTRFVLKGSNFGTDVSKIKVLFNGNRRATVVSSNGTTLYGIVPKQENGDNTVTVSVADNQPTTVPQTFHYTKVERVTTVTGGQAGYVDGTLAEARFEYMYGVGVLKGNNVVMVEGRNNRVRLVAPDDDKVTTLYTGANFGKPAVTRDGTRFYLVQLTKPHLVLVFDQANAWAPKKLATGIAGFDGEIFACALTDDEKHLYFRDHNGKLGRLLIENPEEVEVLNENCGKVDKNISYLVWNPVEKCFYLSLQNGQGIYKVSQDGKTVEEYAGFNGVGGSDGPRLQATLRNPTGMAFDVDGNMYFTESMGHTIRKIDRITGMVTTVAGKFQSEGAVDGLPLEARFQYPYDICIDSDGNFFIIQGWGRSLKKFAIE